MIETRCCVAGEPVRGEGVLDVKSPWSGEVVGRVRLANRKDVDRAIATAREYKPTLSRFQRHQILDKARELVEQRAAEFARLITSEAGLCIRESKYEVGR